MAQTHDSYASDLKQIQIASLEATQSLLGRSYTQPEKVINRLLHELHHNLRGKLSLPELELFMDHIDTKWLSPKGQHGERYSHSKFMFRLDRYHDDCKHFVYGSIMTTHQEGSFLIHGVNIQIAPVISRRIDADEFRSDRMFARRYIEDIQSGLQKIRKDRSDHDLQHYLKPVENKLDERIDRIWDHCKWTNPDITICQFAKRIKSLLDYDGYRTIYFRSEKNKLFIEYHHRGQKEHQTVISLNPHF